MRISASVTGLLLVATCLLVSPGTGHDVITTNLTYTREVSRILTARCLGCHSTNDAIALTNYQLVRPWAVSIKEQVLTRAMPPWGAVKGFGDLQPDGALSQEEMMVLAAWVIGGAPEGDRNLLAPTQARSSKGAGALLTRDVLTIDTRTVLGSELKLAGLKPDPATDVESAKVTACLPDGSIRPLVWLYQYRKQGQRQFLFREPLDLPAGTVIEASTPLRYQLKSR